MPLLDNCITALFEPGNIGASAGEPPTTVRPGTIYTPDDFPTDDVEYSLVLSRFYNSAYLGGLL
jgi:nucleoside-diphosphate-sugar epimerase